MEDGPESLGGHAGPGGPGDERRRWIRGKPNKRRDESMLMGDIRGKIDSVGTERENKMAAGR